MRVQSLRQTFMEEQMDHSEAIRRFGHLMIREADRADDTATELEALASVLSGEKSRQLAQLRIKASFKLARDFRAVAQKVKES